MTSEESKISRVWQIGVIRLATETSDSSGKTLLPVMSLFSPTLVGVGSDVLELTITLNH